MNADIPPADKRPRKSLCEQLDELRKEWKRLGIEPKRKQYDILSPWERRRREPRR